MHYERFRSNGCSQGLAIIDALMCTHDFFDRQTAMDIDGIDTDVLNVLSTEAGLVKQELEAYRIEVAQLKQQQEELWQDEQTAEYELTSVFIHRGSSPSFGHYFFYARCLPDSPDEWFKYNDSDVSLVSKDEVLADTTGSTANPYLVSPEHSLSWGCLCYAYSNYGFSWFSRERVLELCIPSIGVLSPRRAQNEAVSDVMYCLPFCIWLHCERTDSWPRASLIWYLLLGTSFLLDPLPSTLL